MIDIERMSKYMGLLESKRYITASEFLSVMEISCATFKRDLAVLRDRFDVPIVYDRDFGAYKLEHNYNKKRLPGIWFDSQELQVIKFLEEQINLYKKKENEAINSHKNELGDELFKKRVQLEIEKDVKQAMDDVADSVETGAKSGNPYLAAIMIGAKLIWSAAKMLFNVAVSIVKIGFSFLQNSSNLSPPCSSSFTSSRRIKSISSKVSAKSREMFLDTEN